MKTESRIRPTEKYQFNEGGDRNFVVFNDLNSIEETIREDEKIYIYQSYNFKTSAPEDYIIENVDNLFNLVKEKEYNDLANEIREKRNQLLTESDKYMALDRLDLDTSSAIKFLASLKNIFNNDYAVYRQALRDITKQPNFPYEVEFPKKPD